jgi:hypothetical protein
VLEAAIGVETVHRSRVALRSDHPVAALAPVVVVGGGAVHRVCRWEVVAVWGKVALVVSARLLVALVRTAYSAGQQGALA